jgi:imidazolonepropionase-like amidohydrolase
MRKLLSGLIALLALACTPAAAQDVYAITDVTVVPMDSERLLPRQTVVVRAGRIEAIGPHDRTAVPPGSTRIDGRNRYLVPGLAEMHAHVPPNPADVQWTEDVLLLYVANGITFARSMLGAPHHLPLRASAERGEIVAPRIHASGPSFNGNSVASPEDGRRMVREQKAAGYDILKIHPGLDRARYDAIVETAREVGIPFAGHVPEEVGLARALEARQATVDHLDNYVQWLAGGSAAGPGGLFGLDVVGAVDDRKIPEIARLTREAGVWNVPTQSLPRHLLQSSPSTDEMMAWDEMRYVPAAMRAEWRGVRANIQGAPGFSVERARRFLEVRDRLVKALHEAGSGLMLGSDSPQWFNVPGYSLHRELRYMVDAGLTPYQALAMGTVNVARFLGKTEEFGTVAVGRRADLVLLDANPLTDIGNLRRRSGVMLGGRWFPQSELQTKLSAIAERYRD